ncbi:MAG: hypothetical protein ACKVJG_18410 [Candidatus Latescibacterota bacterium]|jgi:hypothetical protein
MKIIGFINHPTEVAAVLEASAVYGEGHEVLFVVGERSLVDKLKGRRFKLLADYGQAADLQKNATLWLDDWAERPAFRGAALKDLLICCNTSLWWFFLPVLAQDVLQCIQSVEAFKRVLEAEKPDRVLVSHANARPLLPFRLKRSADLATRLAEMTARAFPCEVELVAEKWQVRASWWWAYKCRCLQETVHRIVGRELKWLVRRGIAWSAGWTGTANSEGSQTSDKLLVFSCNEYWRETGEVIGGQRCVDDIYIADVLKIFGRERSWDIVDIDVTVELPSWRQCRRLLQKIRRSEIMCRPFERYLRFRRNNSVRSEMLHLQDLWQQLYVSSSFQSSCDYLEVSLWPLLRGRLDYAFRDYAYSAVEYLVTIEQILRQESPSAVLLEYEEGSHGRAAMVAARKKGIPSVALQHGVHAGPYVPSYFFRAVNWKEGDAIRACPIPTRTAVFGQTTSDMLVDVSAYPSEAVTLVGSTMHDVLIRQIGRLDMASSQHSFGLQNGRQTIAVLSSKFTDTQYRTWFVEGVLEAMQAMPEAQCIIKLHPSESADLWLESAEQRGMSAPVIVGNRLWDVIAVADLIVSWYSTTVLDAMMLEKPVVIYANNDRSLAPAFVGRNGIETVGDVEQLVAAITDLMGVKISRRALLEGELYRLDGRASQRLVQLVVDLSNEYKSTGMSTDRLSPIAVGD